MDEYIKKLDIKASPLCEICNLENESIVLSICLQNANMLPIYGIIIIQWIKRKLKFNIKLNDKSKVLSYFANIQHCWSVNFILNITRQYIFQCSINTEFEYILH